MTTTKATVWSANTLRASDSDVKIQDPGIYSGLKMTKVEQDDKKKKYIFYLKDSNMYTDIAVFPEPNPNFSGKTVEQQQKAVVETIISIADAVGSPTEVSKLPPASSYNQLVEMLHKYIESKVGSMVNLKLVLDAEENYTNVAKFGFIEKHIPGQDPKLWYSQWEKDNNRAKRTKPRPKAEAKSDTATMPGSSAADTADFMAVLHDKPQSETGLDLPF